MRYAIVSDIHSNLQAWNAVLLDIRSSDIDAIISLGDVIGYGPNPLEVLESIYSNIDHFVLGNHDAVVCGKMDGGLFNDRARELIEWTAARLGRNATRFLRKLPLSLDGGSFRGTHGDFSDPAAFNYVIDPVDAVPSWEAVREPLLFVGHTHCPGIFLLGPSGRPHAVGPQDFVVEEEKRYLVNVGSVGQPRDGDARSTYCVFDTEEKSVCWRRVPFDLDAYRAAMQTAGLDPSTTFFLRHDPRKELPPLREMLNFSPAHTPEQAVHDAVEVQTLDLLTRSRNRWRTISLLVLLVSLLVAAGVGAFWWRHAHRTLEIPAIAATPLNAVTAPADVNLLRQPAESTVPGQSIRGWHVVLGNRYRQSVHVEHDDGEPVFVLRSNAAGDETALVSPPIRAVKGLRLAASALVKKSPDFEGNVAMWVSVFKDVDGRIEPLEAFISKEPNEPRANDWMLARQTENLPADSASVQFSVRGHFVGTVRVRDLRLEKR